MNNDSPFTTIGDEPVEARIVAWVLGEASAFEIAELERLCEERPELLVFRRRMRTLHGLLTEAEAAQPDEGWKLPPEKRKVLDEVFGGEKPKSSDPVIEKRVRFSARRALLTIAACLILTVVIAGLTAPAVIRQRKRADMLPASRGMIVDQREANGMVPLATALPEELIEGTPKPMNVPNLEAPVNGPAGSRSWRSIRPDVAARPQTSAPAPTAAPAKMEGESRQMAELSSLSAAKPSKEPSRDRAMAVAAEPVSRIPDSANHFGAIKGVSDFEQPAPASGALVAGRAAGLDGSKRASESPPAMPAAAAAKPARLAGNSDHFFADGAVAAADEKPASPPPVAAVSRFSGGVGGGGGGFATGGASADAEFAGVIDKLDAMPTAGLRSGDQAINRNSIDAILNNPNRVEEDEVLGLEKKMADAKDVPVLGERFKTAGGKIAMDDTDGIATLGDVNGPVGQAEGETAVTAGALSITGTNQFESRNPRARIVPPSQPGQKQKEVTAMKSDHDDYVDSGTLDKAKKQWAAKMNSAPADGVALDSLGRTNESIVGLENQKEITLGQRESLRHQASVSDMPVLGALHEGAAAEAGKPSEADGDKPADQSGALDGALRSNPALTAEHGKNVDEVRRSLYMAEGNYNLGKYDDAKREYETTLRQDPYNSAARRGLERIASAKSDYYRAAYDHTRAELLMEVDNAWELSVPADGGSKVDSLDLQYRSDTDRTTVDEQSRFNLADQLTPAPDQAGLWFEQRAKEGTKKGQAPAAAPEPPKPSLTELMEEIPAAEDPYSTFSLNISDASFQVAQAALAKGERPDPVGIKVEQFYNAVDYGDPAPSAGEPVAVSIEQSAHPVIPGRNLVRVALKTAAAGRSASQPLRLTLLVDQSGSMVREDRRAAMDKALAGLSGLLTDKDLVTVVGFSRTPRLLADGLPGDKAGKLAELVNQSASEGGTNLEEAIKLAEQMADRRKLTGAQNRIVLFTDGAANLGNADPARLAERVKALRQKGIAFDIAGIAADGLNDELLGELARNGNGRYYVVGKGADDNFAKQLAGAFRPAAENVKVQVHFNPERVGRYKLIGFEKDRLKTEDFRNDAVDAAELAAEEAGVAVYQVETIPGGKGELGEVSVRFRDAASAQMVERTWAIPHDSGTPAFDRATPSMQLAVLSMLAAEKLKGGPLGEAIDFKQLAEPRANVKRFYGNTGRVAEVLNMVNSLQ